MKVKGVFGKCQKTPNLLRCMFPKSVFITQTYVNQTTLVCKADRITYNVIRKYLRKSFTCNLQTCSKVKVIICFVIMSSLSTEELEKLQNEFIGLDKDGNGEVSIEEMGILLRSMRIKLKLSETQIRRALKQIDANGDGTVDKEEMMQILEKFDTEGLIYKALSERSSIRNDFTRYDTDGSGYITKDELVQIIQDRTGIKVPEKQLALMIKDVDENDDNQINYEEFVKLMTKSSMQRRVY